MTKQIGKLWQEGEILASSGAIHSALLSFLHARASLEEEKKALSADG